MSAGATINVSLDRPETAEQSDAAKGLARSEYWLCAAPLTNFYLNALGAPKFHLVGINRGADVAGTSGLETLTRFVLGLHREPNVVKSRPLSCQA
ncbi:MAG: hypothetical protein HYU76_08890 [Betaproteobacteria bacterium]|nr:hypothetical protein [Betaproteobacteria bacterium]